MEAPLEYDAYLEGELPWGVFAEGEEHHAAFRHEADARLYAATPVMEAAMRDARWALDPEAALLERGYAGRNDRSRALAALNAALAQAGRRPPQPVPGAAPEESL